MRNIPAYAGETRCQPVSSCSYTEHPRVCGENEARTAAGLLIRWNIPAYAGKTRGSYLSTR